MTYFVTTIASLLATIVVARGGEKAPPAATDDGNIMSRVLALEKIVEEQRVQLEDVHDVVSSLHSRRTHTTECFETKDNELIINCDVKMTRSLIVSKEFTANGDSRFEGGNVFINNGMDDCDDINGKGNLIVGTNFANVAYNPGSHNVVIGLGHKYSSFGGLVAGYNNEISGDLASVTGGTGNIASGSFSSISGGYKNKATRINSHVSGGNRNTAKGKESSVSGGYKNNANGRYASVTGGMGNKAAGSASSIGGGSGNQTPYEGSSVTGTENKETKSNYENLP